MPLDERAKKYGTQGQGQWRGRKASKLNNGDYSPNQSYHTEIHPSAAPKFALIYSSRPSTVHFPKLVFAKNEQYDVLIYFKANAFLLSKYVLQDISHCVISPLRGEPHENTLHLSWNIARRFWYNLPLVCADLPKLKWKDRVILAIGNLIRTYTLSTIESYRPKVVLCTIDNSFDFQWISRRARDIDFAVIAQGPRDEINLTEEMPRAPPHPAAIYSIPHYFGWGQRDQKTLKKFGALIDQFHSVGPLRAGYYVATRPSLKPAAYEICLVSQYVEGIMEKELFPEIKRSLTLLHKYLKRYISETGSRMVVAARSTNQREIDYFSRIFGCGITIQRYNVEHFSTYTAIDASELVLAHDSSAAREAFWWGKKVLFTNYSGNPQRSFFNTGPWLLEHPGYDQFKKQVDYLMSLSKEQFDAMANPVRAEQATLDPKRPAHAVLRSWVLEKITFVTAPL